MSDSLTKQQTPQIISIHTLDDDSLLNLFCLYRPFFLGEDERGLVGGRDLWVRGRWWYQLAHVCQRWRNLILGSASYLRLSLVCTNGTPVEDMLAHAPPLPLTVDYYSEDSITAEDENRILLALEQRHRVRHLRLTMSVQNLQKLVMAIDGEFPILEYLIMDPWTNLKEDTPLMLPETLQAPHLRHFMLGSFACPKRPRLHPTATGLVTLCLVIDHQLAYFQSNILLQWISSTPQLESLQIAFSFPVPNRDVERQLTHTPITTHITLPNLRLFQFRGVSAYLEAVICQITTPRLETLEIRLFNQLTFSVPRLLQFMNIVNVGFNNAEFEFKDKEVNVWGSFRETETYAFSVKVDCWHLDWQVSSAAQISNALSQAFSAVEHLTLEHELHSQSSEERNDVDRIAWRSLLTPFSNVKTLLVWDGLVEELSRCLRLEDGELPLDLLPELQELTYFGSRDAGDAFTPFIDARQNSDRPVTLVRPPRPNPNRLPGSCTYCKRLKMKCYFPSGEKICKRCKQGKHECVVEGRGPRSAPNKHKYLLAQLGQKDELIDSLLKQLHNPYLASPLSIEQYLDGTSSNDKHSQNVIAWLDRLQSSVRSTSATNLFQLDTRAGQGGCRSHESDEEHASQHHVPARPASSSSGDALFSLNTLVESDIDPYPDDVVPIGLLTSLAISSTDAPGVAADKTRKGNATAEDDDVGVSNKRYFMPGLLKNLGLCKSWIDKTRPPDILVHKLVTPDDVEKLFEIFYTRINPFISLLEPKLHTSTLTFSRCPVLFTVVCAISLRYSEKHEVYPIAMHFAKSAAANATIDGYKSVEMCQAYILLSIYAVPARRLEEDRSWLYTGLAIRIAADLNLHLLPPKKPTTEHQELEMLNRTRTWIICFNIDKSAAVQFGKPSTLREDHIVRKSREWYKSSNYNHPYDVHIVAHTSLFRIVNNFHQDVFSDPNGPNGLNRSIDFRAVILEHDQQLTNYRQEWAERFERDSDHNAFFVNYARLVMFSFGFQKAFQRGFEPDDEVFFTRGLDSAKTVVTILIDTLVPTGYIRFAPDDYFVFAAFASAFMLKLLRPECSRFSTPGLESEIYRVIERLINTLGSPRIAIDERHTPKLYSRFLGRSLAKHKRYGAAHGRMPQHGPPTQQIVEVQREKRKWSEDEDSDRSHRKRRTVRKELFGGK